MDISFKFGNEKFNYRVCAMRSWQCMMNGHLIITCRAEELQWEKQQKLR